MLLRAVSVAAQRYSLQAGIEGLGPCELLYMNLYERLLRRLPTALRVRPHESL